MKIDWYIKNEIWHCECHLESISLRLAFLAPLAVPVWPSHVAAAPSLQTRTQHKTLVVHLCLFLPWLTFGSQGSIERAHWIALGQLDHIGSQWVAGEQRGGEGSHVPPRIVKGLGSRSVLHRSTLSEGMGTSLHGPQVRLMCVCACMCVMCRLSCAVCHVLCVRLCVTVLHV